MTGGPTTVCAWREMVDLPDLAVRGLRAKLDTGARTSALHAEHVRLLDDVGDDVDEVHAVRAAFTLVDDVGRRIDRRAPLAGFVVVRDAGGREQRRAVVRTRVVCGPIDAVTDVTLTDRSGMIFRMLLGRRTLAGRCLVDPSGGYRHGAATG